jgi:hypothetical protein
LHNQICDLARITLACQTAGIHHDTFNGWRRRDPAFGLQVDQEAARGKIKRLKKSKLKGMMEAGMRLLGWSKGGTRLTSRNLKWP